MSIYFAGGFDLRHHRRWNAEQVEQFFIPLEGMDVEKHCPGSIADICHVNISSRKHPDQPGIHCSETEFPSLCPAPCSGNILQNPSYLGRAEICIDYQACLGSDEVSQALVLEGIAVLGCPSVLPYDGVIYRRSCLGIPHDGSLSLIGYSYRCQILSIDADGADGLCND